MSPIPKRTGTTSALIPGAPTLPSMDHAAGDHGQSNYPGSLGAAVLESKNSVADPHQQAKNLEKSTQPAAGRQPRRPLPPIPNRPSRGVNFLRLTIATLMILAFVALAAYGARKPLQTLIARYLPQIQWENFTFDSPITPNGETPESPSSPDLKSTPPLPSAFDPELMAQAAGAQPLETVKTPEVATPTVPPSLPNKAEAQTIIGNAEQIAPALPAATSPTPPKAPPAPTDPLVEVPATMTPSADTPATMPVPVPPADMNLVRGIPAEAQPAAQALIQFFDSDDLEAKRSFILAADEPEISALIDRYYSINPPAKTEITDLGFIRRDPNPELGDGIQNVFMAASPDWAYPIPVMVQETSDGFKLDWVALVEFKDDFLFKFAETYRPAPGRFHVGIKRAFYFEKDVPDLDGKLCFSLHPPQQHFEIAAFVPKGTPLAELLTREVGWDTEMAYVIADIQWREQDGFQWIELIGVPQMNWHSQPDGGKRPGEPPKATLVE